MLGRKSSKSDRNLQFKEIVRNAVSDVLIVPENDVPKHERVLIPIDFSDFCKDALTKAISIVKRTKLILIIQHIYQVPMGYSKTGKSFLEFSEIMKGHAQNHMNEFLASFDLTGVDYKIEYTLDEGNNTSNAILKKIKEVDPQLVVLGSKGKNLFSALLVGSTAESFLNEDKVNVPLLLTRIRDKSTSFWDAIKEF